ncbi:unnamed protein product [Dicrocoelium dendriticum]|nr:unnamed protein product [Dicrocoelium dendriticum]
MSNRHVARTDIAEMGRAAEEIEIQRTASRQLIQEGRLIRSKELERRRNEEEYDSSTKGEPNNNSRFSSQRSSMETMSSGGSISRIMDARELRSHALQLEEKFKGAMMANVQLDNDKQLLRYEVDLLKDKLEDLRDSNASLHKAFLEKKRDLAYHRMQVAELNHRLEFTRKQIEARDQLLVEHNLILLGATSLDAIPPLTSEQLSTLTPHDEQVESGADNLKTRDRLTNGLTHTSHQKQVNGPSDRDDRPPMALISKKALELLGTLSEPTLDSQIIYLFTNRKELLSRIETLEADLEEYRKSSEISNRYDSRTRHNGPDQSDLKQELQNVRSQAQDFKFKLREALQKNSSLETDILRLEGQLKRYKAFADSCSQQEAELRQERRKYQLELREAQTQLEDYKAENARLLRKLDKLSRSSVAPTS